MFELAKIEASIHFSSGDFFVFFNGQIKIDVFGTKLLLKELLNLFEYFNGPISTILLAYMERGSSGFGPKDLLQIHIHTALSLSTAGALLWMLRRICAAAVRRHCRDGGGRGVEVICLPFAVRTLLKELMKGIVLPRISILLGTFLRAIGRQSVDLGNSRFGYST
jgi:hypothetical protein